MVGVEYVELSVLGSICKQAKLLQELKLEEEKKKKKKKKKKKAFSRLAVKIFSLPK